MPRTKSKAQTRARGTTIPSRNTKRTVSAQRGLRTAERSQMREMPLRSSKPVKGRQRGNAERAYRGDVSQRFDVARGRRLSSQEAGNRYGRGSGPRMGDALQQKARSENRRPTKVAASSKKPRTKLGRAPVKR